MQKDRLYKLLDLGWTRQDCSPSEGVTAILVDFSTVDQVTVHDLLGLDTPALIIGAVFFLQGKDVGVEVYDDSERLWGAWEYLLSRND